MKTAFRRSFERDLKKLKKNRQLFRRIQEKIKEVEESDDPQALSGLEKLSGGGNYFRIRVGDYRIGIEMENETVEFVRCLHHRDIYRNFP